MQSITNIPDANDALVCRLLSHLARGNMHLFRARGGEAIVDHREDKYHIQPQILNSEFSYTPKFGKVTLEILKSIWKEKKKKKKGIFWGK